MTEKKRKATKGQKQRIVGMLESGLIDREEATAIIARTRPDKLRLYVSYAKVRDLEWERHPSCAEIDRTPGIREFWVAEVPPAFDGARITDCRDRLASHFFYMGYRFAVQVEADEIVDHLSDVLTRNCILVAGSTALDADGQRCALLFRTFGTHPNLHGRHVAQRLSESLRLLLVRRDA